MGMAEAVHGHSGERIRYLSPLSSNSHTPRTDERHRQSGIGLHQVIDFSVLISVLIPCFPSAENNMRRL